MIQQIFGWGMVAGFLLIFVSILETTEEMKVPIWKASFRAFIPWMHKTDRGKRWAKLYWVGGVIAIASASIVFQGVSFAQAT